MKIVGWVPWNTTYPDAPEDEAHHAVTVGEIRRLNIRRGGFWHQGQTRDSPVNESEPLYGCPQFEDGTVLRKSMRGWGHLMARAHSIKDEFGMNYCVYAWYGPEEWERMP